MSSQKDSALDDGLNNRRLHAIAALIDGETHQ